MAVGKRTTSARRRSRHNAVRLRVVDTLVDHPLRKIIEARLMCTLNSDDPAYFGGDVGENYDGVASAPLVIARNARISCAE